MTGNPTPNPAQLFEDYLGPAIFQPWGQLLLDLANPGQGDSILDLATATGTIARMAAPRIGLQGAVTGLDFSPQMLAVAMAAPVEGGPPIEWLEGDAAKLPFEDDSFDHVISQQGLQFFPDRLNSAKEIYRVIKPGGRLTVSVWQGMEVHPVMATVFTAVANRLDVPVETVSVPWNMGDPNELSDYVQAGGFEDVKITAPELEISFPSPHRFTQISISAAAAAIPAFAELDAEARASLGGEIAGEVAPDLAPYISGDTLTFNTAVNVASARK